MFNMLDREYASGIDYSFNARTSVIDNLHQKLYNLKNIELIIL